MTVDDDMLAALQNIYPGAVEENVGALFLRYLADNNLDDWEDYVAHVAQVPSLGLVDDQAAFWEALAP